jgi:hypothetical protein
MLVAEWHLSTSSGQTHAAPGAASDSASSIWPSTSLPIPGSTAPPPLSGFRQLTPHSSDLDTQLPSLKPLQISQNESRPVRF